MCKNRASNEISLVRCPGGRTPEDKGQKIERMKKMKMFGIGISHVRLALGLMLGLYIALAGPVSAIDIGPETQVAGVVAPELGSQDTPAVAAWPGGYLAVYQDKRSVTDVDVCGVFIDANGNPIGESFVISTVTGGTGATNDQLAPSVAFNGTNFLVVWADNRGGVAGNQFYQIYGARVSTSGTVLDPNGLVISNVAGLRQYSPEVASNGTDWEVVWQRDTSITLDIYGAKVSAAGVASGVVGISTSSGNDESPAIVWNGSYYMVVFQKSGEADYDVYGVIVTSSGAIYKPAFLLSTDPAIDPNNPSMMTGAQISPRVAAGPGGMCMVVWQDSRNTDTATDVYGVRVSATGQLYDVENLPIYVASGSQETPSVGWDGTNYLVAWRDRAVLPAKLYGTRVDRDGFVLDSPFITLSTTAPDRASGSCAASLGGKTLVLWAVSVSSVLDVYSCMVTSDASVSAERIVSVGGTDQPTYQAAFDGTNFVVVWTDRRAAKSAVYAARVTPFGEVLTPGGVLISSSTSEQKEPAICWNGTMFLVTWTEGTTSDSDIKGVRMNSDLSMIDSTPLIIGVGDWAQYASSIAGNSTGFMVIWTDTKQASMANQTDIMGARVNAATGEVTRISTTAFGVTVEGVCNETHDQYYPSVASDGSNWLVVWQDMRGTTADVYFARLNSTGSVVGTVNGAKVSTATGAKMSPSVAFDGTRYMIAWADYRNDTTKADIYGVRMTTTGARVDASDIAICSVAGSDQSSPSIKWAGDRYFVAWQDARNGAYQIYAARVSAAGSVTDSGGFFVSSGGSGEIKPKLAAGGTNWVLALYGKWVYPVNKLYMRTMGDQLALPLVSVAETRTSPNGRLITLSGKVVTAGTTQLSGRLYVEDGDRTAGICVPTAVSAGETAIVNVTGILATVGGERQITNAVVTVSPNTGTVPAPFGLVLSSLGGGTMSSAITGVIDGGGLNNLGLLVRVCGKVISTGSGYFMMQDGSTSSDVKVACPAGVTLPTVGKTVGVTGISSCEAATGGYARKLLARKPADIVTFN